MSAIVSDIHQTVSSGVGDLGVPDIDTIQAYIKDSPIGENLSDEECRRVAEITDYRRLDADEYLIDDGEVDDSLHIVVSGKLGVVKCE